MEHLEMVIGRQGKDLGSTQTEAAPVCSSSKAFLPSWNSQHAAPWAIQPTASGSLQSITALWQQALSGISLTALYQTAVSLVITTLEVPSGDIWEVLSDSHTVRQSVKVENRLGYR
ncbi:MAG: hypothetical protein MUF49_27210 [Oculatellaceae cyanobacterium Prado106]|nr:hypothetical protein [Oculatellaceae cyanobacterium Prado106]